MSQTYRDSDSAILKHTEPELAASFGVFVLDCCASGSCANTKSQLQDTLCGDSSATKYHLITITLLKMVRVDATVVGGVVKLVLQDAKRENRGRHGDAIVTERREDGVQRRCYATPGALGDASSDIDVAGRSRQTNRFLINAIFR